MSSLTDLLPQTTEVVIGGRTFVVGQLTIRDIAYFQHRLEERQPHPYAHSREAIENSEGELQEALVLKVVREDYRYPPLYSGYRDARELLDFLQRLLSRHQEFTQEDAINLAMDITGEELKILDKLAFNDTPRDQLIRFLTPPKDSNPWERADDWGEILDRIAQVYRWTYDQIGDLTISQFQTACRAGKLKAVPGSGGKVDTFEDAVDRMERERRLLKLVEEDTGEEPQ